MTRATPPILVAAALSARPWRSALQRHVRDHESDLVVELVRDRHQALAGAVEVVVIDDDTSWISASVVDALTAAGKAVVGVYDPDESDGFGQRFLREMGVSLVVPADLPVEALAAFVREHRPDRDAGAEISDWSEGEDRGRVDSRRIIAVGGPSGAGATEVAIGIAQVLADAPTILVDTDENLPGIARRLGLSIHPHVVTALAAVAGTSATITGPGVPTLEDCVAQPVLGQGPRGFDVIAGLASRDDWPLVPADDAVDLLETLARRWTHVIAKVGSVLEDLPGTSRYEVSRQVLRRADRIVAVAHASPMGVLRIVDWLVDAVVLAGDAPIDVVLNQAPANPAFASQLRAELLNAVGDRISRVTMVPTDRRVVRAGWDATTIASGPFLRQLGVVFGRPPRRRRWIPKARTADNLATRGVAS